VRPFVIAWVVQIAITGMLPANAVKANDRLTVVLRIVLSDGHVYIVALWFIGWIQAVQINGAQRKSHRDSQ